MKHFTAFLYFECNFFGFCLGKNTTDSNSDTTNINEINFKNF